MVDTSLFEAAIVHTCWQSAIALASGVGAGPDGLGASAQCAQDGWITVGRRQPDQLAAARQQLLTQITRYPRASRLFGVQL